jgi:hypothetical protein
MQAPPALNRMLKRFRECSRSTGAVVAFALACLVLAVGIQPSPHATVEAHWHYFGPFAGVGACLMGLACFLCRYRRVLCSTVSFVTLTVAASAHSVCDPIPDTRLRAFESVVPLEERARHEPFYKFEGHWFQCKAAVLRALFF